MTYLDGTSSGRRAWCLRAQRPNRGKWKPKTNIQKVLDINRWDLGGEVEYIPRKDYWEIICTVLFPGAATLL